MKLSINDLVDGFFKGVLLVLSSAAISFVELLMAPRRGLLRTYRRLKTPGVEQVSPRVFLFLALFALLEVPLPLVTFLNGLWGDDSPQLSEAAGEAFDRLQATSGSALAATLAAICGVAVLELLLKTVGVLMITRPDRRAAFSSFVEYAFAVEVAVLLVFVVAFNIAAWGKGVPVGADAYYITLEGWWNIIGYTLSGGFFFTVTIPQRIVMAAYVVALPLTYIYSGFAIDTAFGRRELRWDAAGNRSPWLVPTTVLTAVFFWFGVTAACTLFEGFAKDRSPVQVDFDLAVTSCALVAPGAPNRHVHAEGVLTNHSKDGQIFDPQALFMPEPVLRYLGAIDEDGDGKIIYPSAASLSGGETSALVQPATAAMVTLDYPLTARQENAILTTNYEPDCNLRTQDGPSVEASSVGMAMPDGTDAAFENEGETRRAPMQ